MFCVCGGKRKLYGVMVYIIKIFGFVIDVIIQVVFLNKGKVYFLVGDKFCCDLFVDFCCIEVICGYVCVWFVYV